MSILPWLLNWPPHPATVVAVLLVTAFAFGTVVVLGPTIEEAGPDEPAVTVSGASIHLNDEVEIPDVGNDTVATCIGHGTLGDHLTVRADVLVEMPIEYDDNSKYTVELSIANTTMATTESVQQGGRDRFDVYWMARDDETLSVGDQAEIRVRLHDRDTIVANTTTVVTVEEANRSYDCDS